jgi:hypothetical protein
MQANASDDYEFDWEGDIVMKIMRQLTVTGDWTFPAFQPVAVTVAAPAPAQVPVPVPVPAPVAAQPVPAPVAAQPAPAPVAAAAAAPVQTFAQTTYKINYQLNLFYIHTFDNYEEGGDDDEYGGNEADPYDPDSLPGLDCQYCDEDSCSCSGYEFPLNDFELDTYMQEGDRYKKYARAIMKRWAAPESVLGYEAIANIEYKKGGRLSFNLYYKCWAPSLSSDESLVEDIRLAPFETTIYREEPGQGCGAVVPSKHKYGPAGAGRYLERGLIDCRADNCIRVKNMGVI